MKKNNLLIALIAIVFVCLVGVVSYSLLNNDNKENNNKDNLDNNTEVEITSSEVKDSLDEKIKILEIDFEMDIYAAKQEDIDQVRGLIASAKKRQNNVDEELINIISEETEPFFKGQKSASDVSNVIQNRIRVYVNENR